MRALRHELFNPAVEAHAGRVVKRMGDGVIVEFLSVVEAVRCAIEVTQGLAERNAGVPPDRRIEVGAGIHLGNVVEEADGDLLGDGVNIAARLEGICEPGGVCLSEDAWRQVRDRLPETFVDLGERRLKNIARPMRAYALSGVSAGDPANPPADVASIARRRSPGWLDSVGRPIGAYAGKAATTGARGSPHRRRGRRKPRPGLKREEPGPRPCRRGRRRARQCRAPDRRLRQQGRDWGAAGGPDRRRRRPEPRRKEAKAEAAADDHRGGDPLGSGRPGLHRTPVRRPAARALPAARRRVG